MINNACFQFLTASAGQLAAPAQAGKLFSPVRSLCYDNIWFTQFENIERTVRFDSQQQIKVTAWQTLVSHRFIITSNTTLLDLRRAVRNIFDVEDLPEGEFLLYVLNPGDLIEAKRRIESEDQFACLKDVYHNNDPKTAPPALYVWSTSNSDKSPK